jgi:hypothetical protein
MTKRTPYPAILFAVISVAASLGCQPPPEEDTRTAFVDEWQVEAELPAAQYFALSIGDRGSMDNFTNRGNVEVIYEAGTDVITIEMQRFTVASDQASADEAFEKMYYWGYNLATPEKPSDSIAADGCDMPEHESCYIRAYYDGMIQPIRDGVNIRVTIPAGWEGDLDITTSDNLEDGIETYPDRSDVSVMGLNGNLTVDMDSGNANVRLDPNILHFAGCPENDTCEMMGYIMGCGCSTPTNVTIENNTGHASNITVDVANPDNWYTMILENRGTFSASDDFVCNATIDCGSFANCVIDPDFANIDYQERAEVNYPGDPAIEGAGMRLSLVSEDCANIKYVEGPEDYGADEMPEEKRGELHVCVGCLE